MWINLVADRFRQLSGRRRGRDGFHVPQAAARIEQDIIAFVPGAAGPDEQCAMAERQGRTPVQGHRLQQARSELPIVRLSGRQKSPKTPSVSGSARASGLPIARTHTLGIPFVCALHARWRPSGEIAKNSEPMNADPCDGGTVKATDSVAAGRGRASSAPARTRTAARRKPEASQISSEAWPAHADCPAAASRRRSRGGHRRCRAAADAAPSADTARAGGEPSRGCPAAAPTTPARGRECWPACP